MRFLPCSFGRVRESADDAADALARHAGQHEIQDHQVEVVLRELLKGLLAVSDRRHPVVLALEIGRHRVTDGLLVFNKQYTSRLVAHGYHLKSSPARIPPGRVSHTRSAPSVQVVFAFIVAITPEAAGTCAGNDTISTMVTRRSTHAHHAKPSRVGARNAQRRNAMPGGGTYAGGKPDACGGHVGKGGGCGSGGLGAWGASRPAARRNAAQKASVGPGGALYMCIRDRYSSFTWPVARPIWLPYDE